MRIRVGAHAEFTFAVSAADMDAFIALSGDRSSIHTDHAYAKSRGYGGVIVYGGILLAKLSYVLGTKVPGDHGISTRWTIDFRTPLLVDEPATIRLDIIDASPATGLVEAKFKIRTATSLVATGRTQTMLPRDEIEDI